MGTVDLNSVKTGLQGPAGCLAKRIENFLDFPFRYFAITSFIVRIISNNGWSDGQLPSGFNKTGFTTSVIKLNGNFSAMLMGFCAEFSGGF